MQELVIDPQKILQEYEVLLHELADSSSDRFTKVEKIYNFMNLHNSELFASKAVCEKGCAHCCHINIDLTEVEASYIEKNCNVEKNKFIDTLDPTHRPTTLACPFLDTATMSCTIYEFRPSVCRMYHVFESPQKCADKEQQLQATVNSSALIEPLVTKVFVEQLSSNEVLKQARDGLRDIRQWFKK